MGALTIPSGTLDGLLGGAAPAGGGITLISTTNYTPGSAALSITSIPTTYKQLYLLWYAFYPSTGAASIFMRVNGDTGNNYVSLGNNIPFTDKVGLNNWTVPNNSSNIDYRAAAFIEIPDYATTANGKLIRHSFTGIFDADPNNNCGIVGNHLYRGTSAITSISLNTGSGTWSGGVAYLYGGK